MGLNEDILNDDAPEGRRSETDGSGAEMQARDRMRRAAAAVANGEAKHEELQAAARALVAELRQRKEPPEQVLLQIKEFLAEAGLKPGFPAPKAGDGTAPGSSLYRDLITWSIRYYYEDPRQSS